MQIILMVIIVALLTLIYLYFIYAPVPVEPKLSAEIISDTIHTDGRKRHYLSYIPKNVRKNPKLVIALHGTGMNSTKMRQWTGYELEIMADQYGFIVIYPDGYKGNWNDCRKNSPFPASKENINDVGFMETLISQFTSAHEIDTEKVFVFGFSNGGQMAFRLAMERPKLIAAVCAVAANLPTTDTLSCESTGCTSRIMLVAGTADTINPYHGGKVSLFGLKQVGTCISAVDTAKYFLVANNIKGEPEITNLQTDKKGSSLPVKLQSWRSSGTPFVELCSIKDGGHVIPQSDYRFPRLMGKTASSFNTPKKAIEFFEITKGNR
jgi:polyhydroxybutyrate depolymerase